MSSIIPFAWTLLRASWFEFGFGFRLLGYYEHLKHTLSAGSVAVFEMARGSYSKNMTNKCALIFLPPTTPNFFSHSSATSLIYHHIPCFFASASPPPPPCSTKSLCARLQIQTEMDSAYLLETLAGNFMDVVQYNEDNRAFEVSEGRRTWWQNRRRITGSEYWSFASSTH